MLLVRSIALAVLVSGAASASSTPGPSPFEPASRELWNRGSERFQRQWLIAGPLGADIANNVDPVQLKPAAGVQLTPSAPAVKWAPHAAWSDVTDANLSPLHEPADRSIDRFVFAATTLSSATAGPAELSIGSERPYSVWLNGKLVHARETVETFSPDKERIPVELQAGNNSVLLRFHQTSIGPSPFSLRAVPPGTALKRIDEVTPSLVPSNDQSLAVRTHFATEKGAAPVALEIIAAGGEVVARQSAARGETIKFDSKNWRDGAYDIRVSTQNAWKQPQVSYLTWYKGDPIAAARRLIAAADAAKDDVQGRHVRMLAAMVKDRLGGSIDSATPSQWSLVHSPLMEYEELQLETQGRPARLRGSGFVRIAYNDEVDGST